MKDYLVFAYKPSVDFGVFVADSTNKMTSASKRIETYDIPGRNGALTVTDGTYENVPIKYILYTKGDVLSNIRNFRNHLNANTGYQRLEDTYLPEEYRLAQFTSLFEVPTSDRKNAAFEVEFDCMPQRFLRSGEQTTILTATSSIYNGNLTTSKPLVRVYGTGIVTIGDIPITITVNASYTDIDCEAESAYRGSTNLNGNITLSNGRFWEISPGYNTVTLGRGIERIEITPRFWIL